MNNRKNVLFVTLLLSILVFLTACSQPVDTSSETASVDASSLSEEERLEKYTHNLGTRFPAFEESRTETLEDGTVRHYGVFSTSFQMEGAEYLCKLPIVLIAYPDGTFGYDTEADWLTVVPKPVKADQIMSKASNWYVAELNPSFHKFVTSDDGIVSFIGSAQNENYERHIFMGAIEIDPDFYFPVWEHEETDS